jgi:cell division protein FtsQ
MIRKIATIFFFLLFLGYVTTAFVIGNQQYDDTRCSSVHVILNDEAGERLLVADTLVHFLEKQYRPLVGTSFSTLSLHTINKIVENYPLVKHCKSHKTVDGVLHIKVQQRVPILAFHTGIIAHTYLADDGKVIQLPPSILPHVLVASGHISLKETPKQLFELANYIHKNPFWKSQIEQLYVTSQKEIELVPRIGNHIIEFGQANHLATKLKRLKIFYNQVLSQIGWQKYDRINISYRNQVICSNTKKNKRR